MGLPCALPPRVVCWLCLWQREPGATERRNLNPAMPPIHGNSRVRRSTFETALRASVFQVLAALRCHSRLEHLDLALLPHLFFFPCLLRLLLFLFSFVVLQILALSSSSLKPRRGQVRLSVPANHDKWSQARNLLLSVLPRPCLLPRGWVGI